MTKKSKSCISSLIAKTLAKNKCSIHKQPISELCLSALKLGCSQCNFVNRMSVEQAVRNPIQVAIGHMKDQNRHFLELRTHMRNIEDHKKIKLGFETLIEQMKNQVISLCDSILGQFKQRWDNAFEGSGIKISQIKQAQLHYRVVFQELLELNFQNGQSWELQKIMNQFCNQFSEDPTDYLNIRIQEVLNSQQMMPLVDWEKMKSVYETITDLSLWEFDKMVKPCMRDQLKSNRLQKYPKTQNSILLIPGVNNKLKNSRYMLNFDSESVNILAQCQGQWRQFSRLNTGMDSFYEIDKYKLIGVNYDHISIYNYSLGNLRLLRTYPMRACSNLLVYSDCIIAETEGRIIRLWLSDGYKQIVSLSGSNLEYGQDSTQFKFTDSREQTVTHPVFHNGV